MRIVREPTEIDAPAGKRVGLVPTMGAFHEGHLSLMAKARAETDFVVVSLFVNPTQFGPAEDLSKYPRDEAADAKMAEAKGVDLLFAPSVETMYPRKPTTVHVQEVGDLWEGQNRPGHFDGVATVVCKLFNIVRPDVAFFGQKDWQQCAVINRMVADLNMGLELRFCETVREPDGLAMSSRNRYFSSPDRKEAAALPTTLLWCHSVLKNGKMPVSEVLDSGKSKLESAGFQLDYLALVDQNTMEPIYEMKQGARLIVAARFRGVRLIDNLGF